MIRRYARLGLCKEALDLYYQMKWSGIQPNNFTFPEVLKACAVLLALREGMEIHDNIVQCELELNPFVGSALIYMYVKCERVEIARQVFDKICKRDIALWSAMIARYTQNGNVNEALSLFREMELAGVNPNQLAIVSVLPACVELAGLQEGEDIHEHVVKRKNGLESNVSVVTTLVDFYSKCGKIEVARQFFDKMSEKM